MRERERKELGKKMKKEREFYIKKREELSRLKLKHWRAKKSSVREFLKKKKRTMFALESF